VPGPCSIFNGQNNPRLHTIVLYTRDLIAEWQIWCQSTEPFGDPDCLIINWSYKSKPVLLPTRLQSPVRSGSSLQDLHIVLQPVGMRHVWGEASDVELNHKESELTSNIGYLVEGLAELCVSGAKSITIAGAERIGPELWDNSTGEERIPSSAEQTGILQQRTQEAMTTFLLAKKFSQDEVNERLCRVNFQEMSKYARSIKNLDVLGGKMLEEMKGLAPYDRP